MEDKYTQENIHMLTDIFLDFTLKLRSLVTMIISGWLLLIMLVSMLSRAILLAFIKMML